MCQERLGAGMGMVHRMCSAVWLGGTYEVGKKKKPSGRNLKVKEMRDGGA